MSSLVSEELPRAKPEARRRARLTGLALLGVALAPVVAAVLAYLFWTPAGHVNYGELIAPRPLPEMLLQNLEGRPFNLQQLSRRWVLVHIGSGRCDEQCLKKHFYMRQVRLMQGRNTERVERLWLITDDIRPAPDLLQAYAGMHVARVPRGFVTAFPAPADPADHVYLVDPLGYLMLRFPPDPDPKGMHKDLTRLLRASRTG
jgi:hypothetical protein